MKENEKLVIQLTQGKLKDFEPLPMIGNAIISQRLYNEITNKGKGKEVIVVWHNRNYNVIKETLRGRNGSYSFDYIIK